ncbi:MAG: MaoC/PaaZ C-terminal domain-containing protein [Candidatus Nanopelagicales bacterium]
MMIDLKSLNIGDKLTLLQYRVRRADLIKYAGASLDFNPIHYSDRIATSVGLPGVIAHGMHTMGAVARVITDHLPANSFVSSYSTKFTNPVVVPDDEVGALVSVAATVTAKEADSIFFNIETTCGGEKVLNQTKLTVSFK